MTSVADSTDPHAECLPEDRSAQSGATLWRLAHDECPVVRQSAAEDPLAPPDLLRTLADDEDWTVVIAVAENTSTPPDCLARLAGDSNRRDSIRWTAAANVRMPAETLTRLAVDGSAEIRRIVRAHPNSTAAARFAASL